MAGCVGRKAIASWYLFVMCSYVARNWASFSMVRGSSGYPTPQMDLRDTARYRRSGGREIPSARCTSPADNPNQEVSRKPLDHSYTRRYHSPTRVG